MKYNFRKKEGQLLFKQISLKFHLQGRNRRLLPAEKDNAGCYFLKETPELKKPETITENKEFCDCTFQWKFTEKDAHGVSIGKTLPAYPQEPETTYPRDTFTAENAAKIPCRQVLGTYKVIFER